ncbi:MAG: class I SAM-dependent methyltransferase [Ignavibacteria bacterium]|nr:class I SAM-dependent methyltransferase [Ignavibacteria bacterium]
MSTNSNSPLDQTKNMWNAVAVDWQRQVGVDGDNNRRYNSDPVLWALLGDVRGLCVLDAGCGTGYLSKKLAAAGASVTGIDFSEKMIAIAVTNFPDMKFDVDSCMELSTVPEATQDVVVSNYVLMDVPDLSAALHSFCRVLKPGGIAVVVFSHPCFPAGFSKVTDEENLQYTWPFNYYDQQKVVDPPWAHFTNNFIWFHRSLADYFNAFLSAGFTVERMEEPRISEQVASELADKALAKKLLRTPFSVAFRLGKPLK